MSVFKRWQGSVSGDTKQHFVISHFDAYQDGTLAETETAVYKQHLKTCGTCREWVGRQESLVAQLEMEMAPATVLSPAAAARIQQNLYDSMRRAVIMNNIRVSVAAVGALAVLALIVGAVAWWQSSSFGAGVQAPAVGEGPVLSLLDPEALDEQVINAIAEDNIVALAAALDKGADPNAASTPGRPALFLAVMRGNTEAVRLLIDAGADIHAATVDGVILVKAAVEGHQDIVEMLLDAGADINATGTVWAGEDGSALWAAVDGEHGGIVRLLIDRGADVNQPGTASATPPLLIAAGTNQADIVSLLLDNGADIDYQDNDGWTALHAAAFNPFAGVSSPEAARVLIANGAALDLQNNAGQTPLDIALPDVAELLREAGSS